MLYRSIVPLSLLLACSAQVEPMAASPVAVDRNVVHTGESVTFTVDTDATDGAITGGTLRDLRSMAELGTFAPAANGTLALTLSFEQLTAIEPVELDADQELLVSVALTNAGSTNEVIVPITLAACAPGFYPDAGTCASYDSKAFARVNVGGPAYTGAQAWTADSASSPSQTVVFSTSGFTAPSGPYTNNSGDALTLLQSGRWWDNGGGARASARISVANGTYAVRFLVAESVWSTAGRRVFAFDAEGVRRDSSIDPFVAAGSRKNVGVWREYSGIAVNDGVLDLAWPAIADNPEIRAIEIAKASAPAMPTARYPRLSAYAIGNPHNYETDYFRGRAGKYNLVVMNQWDGWQSGRTMTMPQVMKDIKARSTIGTKLFLYVNNMELQDPIATNDVSYPVWQKLGAEKWWLYQTGTAGSPVRSDWGNGAFGVVNNTNFGTVDSTGRNWIKWRTDYDYNIRVAGNARNDANPYVDGFFTDNVFWKPRVDGDWNRDGVVDSKNDPTVQGWLRAGYKTLFDYLRTKWPGSIQLGNIADWGQPAATIGVLDQLLDGGIMESLVGQSWSVESYGGFDAMMKAYYKMYDAIGPRKLVTFHESNWAAGDYKSMRYSLAACLMGDAYFYVSSAANGYSPADLLWFGEFDFDLGYPQQTRRTTAWSSGVWRRDFDNGIVLVNPKGNGTRTVQLGGSFKSIYNDVPVTSITLTDRDGVILRRL